MKTSHTASLIAALTLAMAACSDDDDDSSTTAAAVSDDTMLNTLTESDSQDLCLELDGQLNSVLPEDLTRYTCTVAALFSSLDPEACEASVSDCLEAGDVEIIAGQGVCSGEDDGILDTTDIQACGETAGALRECIDDTFEILAPIVSVLSSCDNAGNAEALESAVSVDDSIGSLPSCAALEQTCPGLLGNIGTGTETTESADP